jgi:hypothetical protein
MLVGFGLSWLLEEVPLRTTVGAEEAEVQLQRAA